MTTSTEENYLKAIFNLNTNQGSKEVGTNEIAANLGLSPATVSSMLKKLKSKGLIHYERYGGVSLLEKGQKLACAIIRKHRLWETFLVEKMEFTWDEIHEVAEQLEHIKSKKLVEQLDKLLGYPKFDPHGDPIPNSKGEMSKSHKITLDQGTIGKSLLIVGVKNDSSAFLQHITPLGLTMKSKIVIKTYHEFDDSLDVEIERVTRMVSQKVARNVYVK